MANTDRDRSAPRAGDTSDIEHDRVRSSNDRDQQAEREGIENAHNRGYDDAVRGTSDEEPLGDVDPDSAQSGVDRDDMIDDV